MSLLPTLDSVYVFLILCKNINVKNIFFYNMNQINIDKCHVCSDMVEKLLKEGLDIEDKKNHEIEILNKEINFWKKKYNDLNLNVKNNYKTNICFICNKFHNNLFILLPESFSDYNVINVNNKYTCGTCFKKYILRQLIFNKNNKKEYYKKEYYKKEYYINLCSNDNTVKIELPENYKKEVLYIKDRYFFFLKRYIYLTLEKDYSKKFEIDIFNTLNKLNNY
jgi:hypothetical protein